MVESTVSTVTTYGPYGNSLVQTGSSGTVYGYTGEQRDAATGLVYLRARYYNPYLNQFQSRDPFPGYETLPASQNGYSYVHGNPVNLVDRNGLEAELPDPFDPTHCRSWGYPRKISCLLITGQHTPDWLRYSEMFGIYSEIWMGMLVSGKFKHAPDFWLNFLVGESPLGNGDLLLEGSYWGNWILTHPEDKEMHDRQLNDFFLYTVWPAALRCENEAGPVDIGRTSAGRSSQYPNYRYVEAGSATHDVTVAIGRHFLEGSFYAKNIQMLGSTSVSADVTINRFIDDRFDFEDDAGGIPVHEILTSVGFPNLLGWGYVPNVWANELDIQGRAHRFDFDIKWIEEFTHEWTS